MHIMTSMSPEACHSDSLCSLKTLPSSRAEPVPPKPHLLGVRSSFLSWKRHMTVGLGFFPSFWKKRKTHRVRTLLDFPGGSVVKKKKKSACQARDVGLIPGSGRSPGGGHGILAWRIPWTEEPGGLQSVGSQRVGHDWVVNSKNNEEHSRVVRVIIWLLANAWSHGGQREGLEKVSSASPFCQLKLKKCKPAESAGPLPPNEGIYSIKEHLFETSQPGFPVNELEESEWRRSGWNWTFFLHTVH